MGQIVKRKKGRPSKADLARRAAAADSELPEAADSDSRRSLRRRNVRYTFDLDDYIDDELDDENAWRREKKLKLLLKLDSKEEGGSAESAPSRTRRVCHAPSASCSSSEYGDNLFKKRKMDGDVSDDDDANCVDGDGDEVRGRPAESKVPNSVSGTPSDPPMGSALPDKKLLELILDKLQKKDIYGVYAEPVDPEELPDYHDVIEHPMDFATVRGKLENGTYFTLEEFESDVLLICTNAMQYNAPDTIYYKQAQSIQELAQKKFQRLRIEAECSVAELKSEYVLKSDSLPDKQIKPTSRTTQEPVGSDFSSGATLATPRDLQSGSSAMQASGLERLSNVDGLVEGNTSLTDNILEKAEDLSSGRGLLSRFVRKPPHMHDEDRRSTYNISNQPVSRSESIFTTFDDAMKQLVPVGLNTDYSYSSSLSRFAATLGPVAWDVASKRIEEGLPPGFKYGRGWVVDYEPLPTPVLILDNCTKKPALKKGDSSLCGAMTKTAIIPTASAPARRANLDRKSPLFCSGGSRGTTTASVNHRQQSPRPRNIDPTKKVINQDELNSPSPSADQNTRDFVAEKQISDDNVSTNTNLLQSELSKQYKNTGKVSSKGLNRNRTVNSDSIPPNQIVSSAPSFPHGQKQGLSDPVQLMRTLAENSQKKNSLNHSRVDNKSLVPSSRSDDSINATAAAARAWMSVGSKAAAENTVTHKDQISAHSLYNSARESHPQVSQFHGDFPSFGMHFQPSETIFPLQDCMTLPAQMGNEAQAENQPVFFPHSVTSDLSRFQVHSPRQGLNLQRQPRLRHESIPPDLNLSFQSSGSPVGQSSGVIVDSQQPDLALQL